MSSKAYSNIPLASVNPGMTIESVYYLVEASEKTTKTGNAYCDLKLRDKTGIRIAKYWSPLEGFDTCSYVFIKGHSDEYAGATQIVVKEVLNVDESDVNLEDFMMIIENIDEFKSTFNDYENQLKNPTTKAFFKTIFNEKFKNMFFDSPASEGARYGAVGGALMQSCRVAALAEQMSYSYDMTEEQKEILTTSAFIANTGKVYAYDMVDHIPIMTLKGSLYGEVALAYQKIILAYVKLKQDPEKASKLSGVEDKDWQPSEDIIIKLTHMALSSRSGNIDPMNRGEKISSIIPQTLEAMILSQCFLTDERSALAYDSIVSSELGHSDPNDPFTPYDFATRRRYVKPQFWEKES